MLKLDPHIPPFFLNVANEQNLSRSRQGLFGRKRLWTVRKSPSCQTDAKWRLAAAGKIAI